MKSLLTLLLVITLTGCESLKIPSLDDQYRGVDAGQAVIGISAAAGTEYSSYTFIYKRSAFNPGDQAERGFFSFGQTVPFSKQDYLDDVEEGVVRTARLAPGEYEIFTFVAQQGTGSAVIQYFPSVPFSIRFTILPGVTTYLGNFQAVASQGQRSTGATEVGPPIFLILDREQRDLALSRKRTPELFEKVENATPAPALLQRDYFVDKVPQEVLDKQRGRVSIQEFLWGG